MRISKSDMSPNTMPVQKTKGFILLRYGLLAIQMLLCLGEIETGWSVRFAVLLLLFINNQLRAYVLDRSVWGTLLSDALELFFLTFWSFETPLAVLMLLVLAFDIAAMALTLKPRVLLSLLLAVYALWRLPLSDGIVVELLLLVVASLSFFTLAKLQSQVRERSDDYWVAEQARSELADRLNRIEHEREGREELVLLRERNRISRDIHDSVGHSLSTIVIQLQAIERLVAQDPPRAAEMAQTLGQFGRESLEKIRLALRELKPETYSAYELVLMLDELCRQTEKLSRLKIYFRYSGEIRQIGQDQGQTLYWVTKEFLTNSTRHGQAEQVSLHLHFKAKELVYNLEDDGVGVDDAADIKMGIGMKGMRERVYESQGTWSWHSMPQKGFHMKIVMPLISESDASGHLVDADRDLGGAE